MKIRIGKGIGDVSETTLRFFKQIGVEDVHMPTRWSERTGSPPTVRPHVPPTQKGPAGGIGKPWDLDELNRVKERIASFDLEATVAGLGPPGSTGSPGSSVHRGTSGTHRRTRCLRWAEPRSLRSGTSLAEECASAALEFGLIPNCAAEAR